MANPLRVVIVGAGPAGLSTALSLAQQSPPPTSITVLETRTQVQALGGAVNLTPLALRYLDSLGVGSSLRSAAVKVSAIELVAHRTGGLLGRLWPDVDAIRVTRQTLLEEMLKQVGALPNGRVDTVFGAKIRSIEQFGDADGEGGVKVTYTKPDAANAMVAQVIEADVLIGCDGIHSQVRNLIVEPSRSKEYSGKCVAYGYVTVTPDEAKSWLRSDGQPLITDTTLLSRGSDSLLMSYYEPSRTRLYVVAVMPVKEPASADGGESASRDGWAARGADKARVKQDIKEIFAGCPLPCVDEVVDKCQEWFFYPVYSLPPGGVWRNGRVLLLGDAAHAMPPQGESTGIAIEDGILLSKVLTRHQTRTIAQLFMDYESLRRVDIDKLYRESSGRWNSSLPSRGWLANVFVEWMTWGFVKYMGWRSNYFSRDVRELELPR